MREFALHDCAIVLVAQTDTTLVAGFVIVHLEQNEHGERRGYVVTLDVHPDARRQGIAAALLHGAQRVAAAAGATRMELHVFAGNVGAICFYERAGYGCESAEPDFYGAGLDAWLWSKAI